MYVQEIIKLASLDKTLFKTNYIIKNQPHCRHDDTPLFHNECPQVFLFLRIKFEIENKKSPM